ncbi:MAG: GGDEF domain-containing protein, partial [Ensifer adhaerens]|nr:GGDEF domain-containing protein [Ensifer adhaerens]
MNLGKRALILIFPVVLAGYLLAAVSVHVTQSRSIRALEHAKLSQRLEHAAAVFQNEIGRSKGFLNALLNGNSLRQYVSETDASYRANALGVRLQESVKSLLDDPTGYVSLALLSSELKSEYYFENSWDPFAEIDEAQLNLARRLIREDKLADWTYLYEAGQRPRIVYSFFLDPIAFTRPLPSKKSNALLVQVAIQPDRFLDMQQALKKEYGSDIVLQPWPQAITDDLSASVHLGPSLYATLTVSSEHFDALMARQKILLALGAVAMSLFSIWLIIMLIRRFITDPIATLDANVMAVMVGARDEIRDMEEKGEIGRLTENIRELHRQSVQSLKLVQRSSWTDTLTGISNRGHFNALAAGVVREAIAAGEKCSLLFIDIDNFKFVNDKHGHEIGDELLKTLATRIAEHVDV